MKTEIEKFKSKFKILIKTINISIILIQHGLQQLRSKTEIKAKLKCKKS